jgi:lysophospholipase L1-like esterase
MGGLNGNAGFGGVKSIANPPLGKRLMGNFNNIISRRSKQTLSAGDNRINTTTFNTIFQCPFKEFTAVRLIYGNLEASTFTVKSIIGVSADVGTGGVSSSSKWTLPSNPGTITNDGTTGWQAVTYSGSATGTVPLKGTDTTQPGLLFSDWIPMTSLTPTNGASRPFLVTRTIVPTGTTFTNLNHKTDTINKTYDNSVYCETFIASGDFVTTPASFSGGSNQSVSPVIGVEFMVSSQIIRVLCVGDSITQGVDNTGGVTVDYYSWVQKAGDIFYTANLPVSLINCGYSGATTTQIAAFGKLAINAHLPNMVFYPPFSPNDGTPTQTLIDTQYRRAMDFANYALSKNVLPVFIFLAPKDYSSTDDAFRKALIARCKSSGVAVCDMTTASGDGATPERYQTGLNSDATHPNAAGYTVMAPVAVSTILDIINRNMSY